MLNTELTRTEYDRQNRIPDLRVPQIATIVGCGGTGFWTALFLAMSGTQELILIDSDILDRTNLNRLPLTENVINYNKVDALKNHIRNIRRAIRIETHNIRLENPIDLELLRGVIFCCTDNLKSQQMVCAYCKKNELDYQRIGYDGTILNVSKSFPLSFEEATDEGGYSVTPSWVIPAVLAAALGVSSKMYKEICIMDDIGKLGIKNCSHVPEKTKEKILENSDVEEKVLDRIQAGEINDFGYCDECDR